MNDDIIKASSPLGYTVRCSKDQWETHIKENHPVMSNNVPAIIDAIENPVVIYSSRDNPNRDVYFGMSSLATYSNKLYTKVIVSEKDAYANVRGNAIKDMITTFPAKEIGGNVDEGGLKYVNPKPRL